MFVFVWELSLIYKCVQCIDDWGGYTHQWQSNVSPTNKKPVFKRRLFHSRYKQLQKVLIPNKINQLIWSLITVTQVQVRWKSSRVRHQVPIGLTMSLVSSQISNTHYKTIIQKNRVAESQWYFSNPFYTKNMWINAFYNLAWVLTTDNHSITI